GLSRSSLRWPSRLSHDAMRPRRHVDAAGWSGDPDRIVAFHLLHGDSDDAPASHQFAQRFGLGAGYLPLMDMFFNQTGLPELYSTAALPHRVSDVLREAGCATAEGGDQGCLGTERSLREQLHAHAGSGNGPS
ncbi:unnamed protein product, partial [Prorocentrum cordatum]